MVDALEVAECVLLLVWLSGWQCQSVLTSVQTEISQQLSNWNSLDHRRMNAVGQSLTDWHKLWTDIHVPERMTPTDFGDPMTIPLAPPWGLHFLQFWLKHSNNCWMDCHNIWYTHAWIWKNIDNKRFERAQEQFEQYSVCKSTFEGAQAQFPQRRIPQSQQWGFSHS